MGIYTQFYYTIARMSIEKLSVHLPELSTMKSLVSKFGACFIIDLYRISYLAIQINLLT